MESFPVTTFTISQNDFDALRGASPAITVHILYYYDAPAGYEIKMTGPEGNKIICARPCPTYFPPPQP